MHERLDEGQSDAEGPLLGRADARTDADALVADDHLDGLLRGPQVHLEWPFPAFVGMQHDVVAGLRDGGADVIEVAGVEVDGLGDPGEHLADQQDVLGAVREAQADIGKRGHRTCRRLPSGIVHVPCRHFKPACVTSRSLPGRPDRLASSSSPRAALPSRRPA